MKSAQTPESTMAEYRLTAARISDAFGNLDFNAYFNNVVIIEMVEAFELKAADYPGGLLVFLEHVKIMQDAARKREARHLFEKGKC